jgi:hypothetical protein
LITAGIINNIILISFFLFVSEKQADVKDDKQKLLNNNNKDVKADEKPKTETTEKSFLQEIMTPHILIANLSI